MTKRSSRLWAILACLGCVMSVFALAPLPARADQQLVAITFTEVTGPDPSTGRITISGTITNTSGRALRQVQVMLWRNRSVVAANPNQLDAVLTSSTEDPIGARISQFGPSFQDITTDAKPVFAAGEKARFTVTATLREFQFDDTPGVYLLGVHVRGNGDSAGITTIARGRTLFARPANISKSTATVTSVVMLSSPPSLNPDGTFVDDHLSVELTGDGRLKKLLTSAKRANVSYAIDPLLLREVTAMNKGYQIRAADGSTYDGKGQHAAAEWLAEFNKLPGDGWRLPTGLPDFNGLTRREATSFVERLRHTDQQFTNNLDLPLLVAVPSGGLSSAALRLATSWQPKAVLTSTITDDPTVSTSANGSSLVRTEANLFAGGPAPDGSGDLIRIRDRRDGQTLVTALAGRPNQVRLIFDPEDALADAFDEPAWIRRQSLTALLASPARSWSGTAHYPHELVTRELSHSQIVELAVLNAQAAILTDLVVDPEQTHRNTDHAITLGSSSWWSGNLTGQQQILAGLHKQVDPLNEQGRFSITVAPKVTLTARDGTYFPATVVNPLDQAIRVRPVFVSDQPQRLRFPDQELLTIGPGQSFTVNVRPEATVNGTVMVRGHLETANGHRVSQNATITVESTNLGQAGWIIVAISGIVLVGTTTLRIRQVRARHVREAKP